MLSAATCMDWEIAKWRKKKTNIIWDHLSVSHKCDRNELIYKTETDSETKNRPVVVKGRCVGKKGIESLGLADANY